MGDKNLQEEVLPWYNKQGTFSSFVLPVLLLKLFYGSAQRNPCVVYSCYGCSYIVLSSTNILSTEATERKHNSWYPIVRIAP